MMYLTLRQILMMWRKCGIGSEMFVGGFVVRFLARLMFLGRGVLTA